MGRWRLRKQPEEVKQQGIMQVTRDKSFQAEGRTSSKALRQNSSDMFEQGDQYVWNRVREEKTNRR